MEADLACGETVHLRTAERLAPGDEVRLGVPPDRVLAYAR